MHVVFVGRENVFYSLQTAPKPLTHLQPRCSVVSREHRSQFLGVRKYKGITVKNWNNTPSPPPKAQTTQPSPNSTWSLDRETQWEAQELISSSILVLLGWRSGEFALFPVSGFSSQSEPCSALLWGISFALTTSALCRLLAWPGVFAWFCVFLLFHLISLCFKFKIYPWTLGHLAFIYSSSRLQHFVFFPPSRSLSNYKRDRLFYLQLFQAQ